MHNTRVDASLLLTGATLDNPAGTALDAGGLSVGGGLFLNDGFASAGQVRLVGARLAANFTLSASVLSNPGAIALNLDRGAVGVVHGASLACDGQFTFVGARVSQDIDLRGARLVSPAGQPALVGERASVDGALILSEADAQGEIALRSIRSCFCSSPEAWYTTSPRHRSSRRAAPPSRTSIPSSIPSTCSCQWSTWARNTHSTPSAPSSGCHTS